MGGAVGAAYGWWAVGLDPFSGAATAAVLAGGVAAMAWGARRPAPPRPAAGVRAAVPWVVLAAVAATWQLAAFVQHPRDDHPTLSSLTNALLDSHAARAVAFVAWLAAAAGLGRR